MKLQFTIYHHWQPSPVFWFYWRWKTYKETFEIAIILFSHWYGIILDHPIFGEDDIHHHTKNNNR